MSELPSPATTGTFKRLLSYLGDYKLMFAIAFVGNVIYALMEVLFIKALEPLTDRGLVGGDIAFMKMVPLYIIGIVFIRGLAGFISSYCMSWIGQHIVQKMRQQLISNYTALPPQFFDDNNSGQLVSKVTFNTQQVAAASTDALTKLFREGIVIIGSIGLLFYTNWQLASIFFISIPIIGVIVNFASKRFKKISKNIQTAMGGVTQTTQEIVDGYKEIKTFGGEKFEEKRFYEAANKNRRQMMKMNVTKAISTPLIQFIASFAIAIVIFYAAVLMELQQLTAGQFIYMLSAMMALLKPLKVISNLNNVIQQGIAAAESVFEIIDTDKEKDQGQKELKYVPQTIQFQNVNFQYPNANMATIKNISLQINQGETIALVGRSGSGKTTLAHLLLRFYELQSGKILFDGTNIDEFTLKSLRHNIAIVSQQVTLFNDTVEANIAYAASTIDQPHLIDSAKKAHADHFIQQFPEGYQTLIGENGSRLSGGQKQRLAIARAIYKNSPIIILDEATSALDTEAERHIQAAMDALTENRTTLVIAHRLSTIEQADKIVVMDNGEIVEQGTHQALLQANGEYARLHAMQFTESE
ncbi:lipid A export permease/ATP-binding protein MsbA [Aliikangiella maris]|uniref:Lipid A export permease/ATP-binding protein MsbA n=2 Tax=Aliikangiella maris TaxID=3162458 RepID=A0ABV2BU80_9GAMM